LLGMSASREASLLGKISQLERQLEKNNSWLSIKSSHFHRWNEYYH
jgi:hypothetical protein